MSGPDWIAALFLFFQADSNLFLLPALFAGLLAAWIVISPVPAILLSAPDEQSCLMTTPGQALVRAGESLAAVKHVGQGSLIGLLILGVFLPLSAPHLAITYRILAPHLDWMLWSAVVFLVLSERPRSAPTALSRWRHIAYTLAPIMAGLATLSLSGLLGLILYFRSPFFLTTSILNFVPALIGLFAVPGLLKLCCFPSFSIKSGGPLSSAKIIAPMTKPDYLRAITFSTLSGSLTAIIPALTGTMGALFTQHLIGTRNPRTQLVAQGITRMLYYGAGLFLIFLPGVPRMRNSSGALLRTFYEPIPSQAGVMITIITLSALAAWLILPFCAKGLLETIERYGTRPPALMGLTGILLFVSVTTSWPGLLILLTATGIGMLPLLFEGRPLQGIGLILIPVAVALAQ